MKVRVIDIGNSKGIIIPKQVLEFLDLPEYVDMKPSDDGKGFVIMPVKENKEGK